LGVGDLLHLIFEDSGKQGIKTAKCLPSVWCWGGGGGKKKLFKISEVKMKEIIFIGLSKLNNYSKAKILVPNQKLQKEEPERHLKKSAETFYVIKKLKITVKFCRG